MTKIKSKLQDPPCGCDYHPGLIAVDSPRGKQLGFTADKFSGYLWDEPGAVVISLIVSQQPGNSYLSQLFAAIHAEGKAVKVPTPSARMRAILEHKGAKQTWEDDKLMGPVEVLVLKAPNSCKIRM